VSYIALRFDAPDREAELWSDALLDAGALSVDVSDPAAGTPEESPQYGEPGGPGSTLARARIGALWPVSRLVALFAADADTDAALSLAATATGMHVPPFETSPVAEQDWVRTTQSQFGPVRIAAAFWIVPSWSTPPEPAALNLKLDPGLAFGTGSHPTTRLCLEWLREQLAGGESVLDYGCGSGILAIAAMKLGAGSAMGTDLDPQAIRASADNATANDVVAKFTLPDAMSPRSFDVVVANILANPLTILAPLLSQRVLPGGHIALSGILAPQADAVAAAYARWFNIATWRSHDGWVLLTGERKK
jgi:ribosomal protein L11 methyltransferase